MGNRHAHGQSTSSTFVPAQDPLMGSFNSRVVMAELNRDFEYRPQVLGTGYSGAVRLAQHISTDQQVAVKEFNKKRLKDHRVKLLQTEVEVYLRLDHPNICKLLYAYEGKHNVWLVMELCDCELYKRLCEQKVYGENYARGIMLQMLQAINYLHTQNIVHRDLKLENWMYGFTEEEESDRLKLIDFGFSHRLSGASETLDMPCGTLHYISPEVLAQKYTRQCDMWSLGVIGYMLLNGRPPFWGSNNHKIARAIRTGTFPMDGNWTLLSNEAQDFITKLLCIDEAKRMDAATALEHPWMTNIGTSSSSSHPGQDIIGVDTLRTLRKFAQGSHFRRAALNVMAYSLTSRELQDLEKTFFAFDKNKQGTITMQELAEVMKDHNLAVSNQELERIFQSMDFELQEEIHYTPFIAAMLATRINYHEDKVRTAFEAFDPKGTGYITAETLAKIFNGMGNKNGPGALTPEEAEQWIREVDYKGNGVIDFEVFLAALKGKHSWDFKSMEEGELPQVRVFNSGPRSLNENDFHAARSKSIRHKLAYAMIDETIEAKRRPKSVNFSAPKELPGLQCKIDEDYFR